jgi:dolichol kinase
MLLSLVLFPKVIAVLSILYLALGDPVASAVGIACRDVRTFKLPTGKSLLGTAAAALVCAQTTYWLLQQYAQQSLADYQILYITLCGAAVGSLSEISSPYPLAIDDNFLIPIISGLFMWFMLKLQGIEPEWIEI